MSRSLPLTALVALVALACGSAQRDEPAAAAAPKGSTTPPPPATSVPANPPPAPRAPLEAAPQAGPFALVVSFYSPGDGTDREAIAALDAHVAAQAGRDLGLEQRRWGREGEVDYCFTLAALTPDQRAAFIGRAQELMAPSRKVHLYADAACR